MIIHHRKSLSYVFHGAELVMKEYSRYDGKRQKGKISKGKMSKIKMSKTKMRGEDEHVRLRVRVREICTSIHSHFQHFYLSTFVLFSFSTFLFSTFFLSIFFLSAFLHPFIQYIMNPLKFNTVKKNFYLHITYST